MFAAGVLTACVVTSAAAQTGIQQDKQTYFTFSGPVSLPGVTLQAGSYQFLVPNPDTAHRVVQVMSRDGKTSYGLFSTRTLVSRDTPTTPEVLFMETAADMPAAIRTWWYPYQSRGFEFIYPREQALRLAKNAKEPVLTTKANTTRTEETNTEDVVRVTADGKEVPVSADDENTPRDRAGKVHKGEVDSSQGSRQQ